MSPETPRLHGSTSAALARELARAESIADPHRRRLAVAKLRARLGHWVWNSSDGPAMHNPERDARTRLAARSDGRLRLEGLALDAGEAPATVAAGLKWCALFPVGTTRYRPDFPGGAIDFDAAFFAAMLGNWQRMGKPALPVDYAHDEDDVAAGWIEDLRLEGAYLWGGIRWTEDATAEIKADKRRFLSPTFSSNGWDATTGKRQGPTLFGAALLNTPFLFDLPRVAAGREQLDTTHHQDTEKHMNKKQICALLGMPEDAADEAVMSELTKRLGAAKCDAQRLEKDTTEAIELAVKPLRASLEAKDGEVKAAVEEATKLSARVTALEAEKVALGTKALCTRLLGEGRIVAAQQADVEAYATKLGLKAAEDFFGKLPAAVRLGEKGISGKDGDDKADTAAKAKAYWAAVDKLKADRRAAGEPISTPDACARIDATNPELAQALHAAPTKRDEAEA